MKTWMWWALGAAVVAAAWWKSSGSPAARMIAAANPMDPRLMLSLSVPMGIGRVADVNQPAWAGFGSAGYK